MMPLAKDSDATHAIVVMTDQHARHASGAYGSSVVKTPHIDALAAAGTLFETAYCASPMCVPSRAAFMTGRFVHEIGAWDNAHAFSGEPQGWAHELRAAGVGTAVIGKMHFRSASDDTGFDEVILPMDVKDGVGDLYSLIRDDMEPRPALASLVRDAGVGDSPYLAYDQAVLARANAWLDRAPTSEPWMLLVSFASPHHPLLAPQKYWDLYPDVDMPVQPDGPDREHRYAAELRRVMGVDDAFTDREILDARRAYFALCSLADDLTGGFLEHAASRGFDSSNTTILYTSDHGTSTGERGMWWKHHLYEESVGVPLIVAGPGFAAGERKTVPVSQTSVYSTLLEIFGVPARSTGRAPALQDEGSGDPRGGFAEYHGLGATSAAFMLREGPLKLIYYTTEAPQLFDLARDPHELDDLADDPGHIRQLHTLLHDLRSIVNPEEVDRAARDAQERMIAEHGGREAILSEGFTIPFTPVPQGDTDVDR